MRYNSQGTMTLTFEPDEEGAVVDDFCEDCTYLTFWDKIKLWFSNLWRSIFKPILPLVSAQSLDSVYDSSEKEITISDKGDVIEKVKLIENTDVCGVYCYAIKDFTIYKNLSLVDGVRFYRLIGKDWVSSSLRSYKFYLWTRGQIESVKVLEDNCLGVDKECTTKFHYENISLPDWSIYNGEVLEGDFNGTDYTLKLVGYKRPSWIYEWQVLTNSIWTTQWATWGNISDGDQAEIILNSPVDHLISYNKTETFNCTVNITGGSYLVNISLWQNLPTSEFLEYVNNESTYFHNDTGTTSATLGSGYPNYDGSIWMNMVKNMSTQLDGYYIKNVSTYCKVAGSVGGNGWTRLKVYLQNGTMYLSEEKDYVSGSVWELETWDMPFWVKDEKIAWISFWSRTDKGTISGYVGGGANAYWGINTTMDFTETFVHTIVEDIDWTCQACDSDGVCGFSLENRTLLIDVTGSGSGQSGGGGRDLNWNPEVYSLLGQALRDLFYPSEIGEFFNEFKVFMVLLIKFVFRQPAGITGLESDIIE